MISMYPPGTEFPVYCMSCYRSDNWNPLSYGQEYDFEKPFFEQFKKLKNVVPRAALVRQGEIKGSEYCNRASYNKDCYLLIRANYNENCRYSYTLWESRDVADCFNVHKSELVFEGIDLLDCYNIQYSQECKQCRDSYFLFNCRNCTNCVGCVGLRNAQYHILNQPYSKDEYEKKYKELDLDTAAGLRKMRERFSRILTNSIHQPVEGTNNSNVSGNWLDNCSEVKNSFQCREVQDGGNLLSVVEAKDCMDYSYWGRSAELVYESANCGYNVSNIRFSNESWDSCSDLTYTDNCYSSSYLFGCVGLKSREYCILNRQYSKEEYEELVSRIIGHMDTMPYTDKRGLVYKFGEFFPPELSPSAYNTTVAHEHFPLSQEEAEERGYFWEEPKEKEYKETRSWEDLPEHVSSVDDGILKEMILCEAWDTRGSKDVVAEHNCTKVFRIIPEELAFYRRMNIPLPRKCPNSRHFDRLKKRNPWKTWNRTCMCAGKGDKTGLYTNKEMHKHHGEDPCSHTFETSYDPEGSKIIYCKECYQSEIT